MDTKPKYLITNLVYGDTYARLFLNNHLKSLLDPTNLPAIAEKYDIEYMIYTDHQTLRQISTHPAAHALNKLVKFTSYLFKWPDDKLNRFNHRYGLLLNMFKEATAKAIKDEALLTCWVADLVVAKEFFPRIMKRIEDGHGAVFVLPFRSAAEPMTGLLMQKEGALQDMELMARAMECMHPLWVACNWKSPQFTKLPFCITWSTIGGLMVRTFSTTPIIFRPKKEMLDSRGMIDGDIPKFCENPYWATNWTDAPVIGVEPIVCYYPPFGNRGSSISVMHEFIANLDPSQLPFLNKRCFYPDEKTVSAPAEIYEESDHVVASILEGA